MPLCFPLPLTLWHSEMCFADDIENEDNDKKKMKSILAARLKQCRKERGLSQINVAVACGISERAYQNYEILRREPKLEILVRIADYFGVSLDYLVGRTDKRDLNR